MRLHVLRPTALELLVLLLAAAIVATFAAPQAFRPRGDPRAIALADLNALGAALETYRFDSDSLPTPAQGLDALVTMPSSAPRPWNWRGPYVRPALPRDPWGNAYRYERNDGARGGYVLRSYGADGQPGGTDESADILLR